MKRFEQLKIISKVSLKANLIETSQGTLCVAGAHQFKTLWTRDFCYSVPGLLRLGETELVKRQLDLIAKFRNEDGFLPRGLDVVSPKIRVLNALLGEPFSFDYQKPLRAEYLGEHKTLAFDSNILWVRAALYCAKIAGDRSWIDSHQAMITSLLNFYVKCRLPNGLWEQPPFSDWMDSQRRTGPQLAFHLLLWQTLKMAEMLKIQTSLESAALRAVIETKWFGPNKLWVGESSDALLLALENNFGQVDLLLAELRLRPIGVPTVMRKENEYSWSTSLIGMRHYHDGFAWSWLTAETARVVRPFDDNWADAILQELENLATKSKTIPEIYYPGSNEMVEKAIYRSEHPFSWGAAKILEAL